MWTAEQICDELWELLGEPSDLDPDTAAGWAKLLRWANEGQRGIASYKFPDGRLIRFPCLQAVKYFNAVFHTGTLVGGAAASGSTPAYAQFDVADTSIGVTDEQYTEWIIEITGGTGSGQTRLITSYNGGSKIAYVNEDWTTAPDSTSTYQVSKRWYQIVGSGSALASENIVINPVNTFTDLLGVWDASGKTYLERSPARSDIFLDTIDQAGEPTSYYFRGNRIVFNYAPDEVQTFRLEYYRQPVEMTATTDYPEIPDAWHQAIALAARWFGFCRAQESAMAYSAKRDFQERMQTIRQSLEMSYELEDAGVSVDRG